MCMPDLSQVVIITNSGFGWVHETAVRFMPLLLSWAFGCLLQAQVHIISRMLRAAHVEMSGPSP